ncbi:hypothetical protein COU74_02440 [Candidatus Peregrinibacteria bacterium CG10_big_fil_rev_8_21_14_0_10_36_19]|nr:MAG: hypothetical protein COU74_02440 [Candidatus Peregrinibacteria bacterium CG10_big_fil_rev_8_21_14_0_10_36_19]
MEVQRSQGNSGNEIIDRICEKIDSGEINLVAIDGPPGIGKTTLIAQVIHYLAMRNMPYCVVGTDDDCIERDQRDGLELLSFHTGEIVRRVINAHVDPRFPNGASLDFKRYSSKTGKRDEPHSYNVPGSKGVLIVEGVRSSEHTLDVMADYRSEVLRRCLFVLLEKSGELVEMQRLERDMNAKGLAESVVMERIASQRDHLSYYFGLLRKRLHNAGDFEVGRYNRDARIHVGTITK